MSQVKIRAGMPAAGPLGAMPGWLPFLLGFISAVGPLSTDMYLPGLPAIEASFHAPVGSAQITLAAWMAGLAVGQITQGTLSDRFGRRRPILGGLLLYTLASAGCALATGMTMLSFWRVLAAFGGSAGMVIPRAVVRDVATGNKAARMMSQLMLVMGVAPILAPALGGAMIGLTGWRGIFWFETGYGVLASALLFWVLPETWPAEKRVSHSVMGQLRRWRMILVERGFYSHSMVAGAQAMAVFTYLGGSPLAYQHIFGLSPMETGLLFGVNAVAFIAATQINGLLVGRVGSSRMLRIAAVMFTFGGLALAGVCIWGGGFWAFSITILVTLAATGLMSPNAPVGALARHAPQAGSASALLGSLQYGTGAAGSALVTLLADGTMRPMGELMLVAVGLALTAEWLRR